MRRADAASRWSLSLAVTVVAACAPQPVTDAADGAARPTLSDPRVAHVAVTANRIDVEMAELAQSRASDPEVRRFAQTMITDHTAVNGRAAALAQRLGVTPEDNPVSQSLQRDAVQARAHLSALRGEAFDRAYIEREVAFHRTVLDALDDTLIPEAESPELRALLQEVRPAIAAHLERAKAIQASLGGGR